MSEKLVTGDLVRTTQRRAYTARWGQCSDENPVVGYCDPQQVMLYVCSRRCTDDVTAWTDAMVLLSGPRVGWTVLAGLELA